MIKAALICGALLGTGALCTTVASYPGAFSLTDCPETAIGDVAFCMATAEPRPETISTRALRPAPEMPEGAAADPI
ncbi:MAG: hypothetical protein JO048_03375 [Methylobacteriaceae bacterium]|nr:hypothetical protein [Methylobacteriaceae bacterium]